MKTLENLNDDLFKPFEEDKIEDLQDFKGGKTKIGESGGNIYPAGENGFGNDMFCWGDIHYDDGSYVLTGCEGIGTGSTPKPQPAN